MSPNKPTYEELEARLAQAEATIDALRKENVDPAADGQNVLLRRLKQTEQALRESNKRFRSIIENLPMGVHMYRLEAEGRLRFIDANPAADTILGVNNSQYIGKSIEEAFPAIVDTDIPERFRALAEKGGFWQREQITYQDERIKGAFDNFNFQTAPGIMASFFIDITERKRGEEALRKSEESFRLLVQGVEEYAIFMLDPDGKVATWNRGAEKMKGYRAEEIIGQHFSRFYPAEDVEDGKPQRQLKKAAAEGSCEDEALRVRKDGSRFFASVVITALRDETGRLHGFSRVTHDITERKRTEEEIGRLARFPGQNPNPVLRVSGDGTIIYANEGSRRLLDTWGCETGQALPERFREVVRDVLAAGASREAEVECEDRVLSMTFAPLADADCVNLYGLDITERKRAEELARRVHEQLLDQQRREKERVQAELAKVRDELVRTTRLVAIGQISASIAHELRNPLGAVRNAAYYLRRRYSDGDERLREYLGIIDQEVSAADRIIGNLLEMARSRKTSKTALDFGRIARETFDRAGEVEGLRCRMSLDPDPFVIRADPDQFRQVVLNLLSNAMSAMGESGEFLVEASRSDDWDTIMFRDTGPGVAPHIQKNLFDPLVTTKAKGTGLGLTICKQIVEAHGGTIELVRREGRGAAFRIRLPRQ